ncbi:MAG: hypothetical protein WBX25_05015 [Rhodomicrobium sp.]
MTMHELAEAAELLSQAAGLIRKGAAHPAIDRRTLRATGRSEQFNFKARKDLKRRVIEAANREGISVAEWMERAIGEATGDPVKAFIKRHTTGGIGDEVTAAALYKAFTVWAEAEGHAVITATALGRPVHSLNVPRVKRGGVVYYKGIAL